MKTVTFKEAMDRIFRRRGLDPSAVSATQQGLVADFVSERVRSGWEFCFWPEWTYLEKRAYRPSYYAAATYAKDEEVWDGADDYYSSVGAGNTNHALTDTTYWTNVTATVVKSILLEQPGKTRIGTVKDIYTTEDNAHDDCLTLNYYIDNDRLIMNDSRAGATVWVKFRKQAPKFTAEAWSSGGTYDSGWVVYYPSSNETQVEGNCYMARLTEGNVEYWELMELPQTLENYVVLGSTADYFRNDAQLERADILEEKAEEELDRAYRMAKFQNGLADMVNVVVV